MIGLKREDIVILTLILVLTILSFFIIRSFIIPLIFTLVLVYILNPVYKRIRKVFKYHIFTSISIIILFFLLFIVPIGYAIVNITTEFKILDNDNVVSALDNAGKYLGIEVDLGNSYEKALLKLNIFLDNLFYKVPEFIFHLFLITFFYYYFSKDYNHEINFLKSIFHNKKYERITTKVKKLVNGIVYGQILVRFIQALIGTLGFLAIGVEGSLFLGILLFFAAFLPLIGTGLIWGPLAFSYMISNDFLMMVLVLIIGFIISIVDNILLPYVISERINIGPVITLISIIGGLQLFGFYPEFDSSCCHFQ